MIKSTINPLLQLKKLKNGLLRTATAAAAAALVCTLSLPAAAVPTRLTAAAWMPSLEEADTTSLNYIRTLEPTRSFLDLLTGLETGEWETRFTRSLQALPSLEQSALPALRSLLISEAFDINSIWGSTKEKGRGEGLTRSVCVTLNPEKKTKRGAILVTATLGNSTEGDLTALFAVARQMAKSRLQPVTPVWFCALPGRPSGAQFPAVEQIHRIARTKPMRTRFSTHIHLDGESPQAFVNYMGTDVTTIQFTEKSLTWQQNPTNASAYKAAAEARKAVLGITPKWKENKTSPFLQMNVSDVVCDNSFLSAMKPSCRFEVVAQSRDRPSLLDIQQTAVATVERTTESFNINRDRRVGGEVNLEYPRNVTASPFALDPAKCPAVHAWRTTFGANPAPENFVSTRFVVSAALPSAVRGASTITLGVKEISQAKSHAPADLARLAETILLLAGHTFESVTVMPLSE